MRRVLIALIAAALLPLVPRFAAADIELFADSPLFVAVRGGDVKQVEALLARRADVNLVDLRGRSVLIYAAVTGNADVAGTVLRFDPRIDHRDQLGNTALFYAASLGHVEVTNMLVKAGANKDTENRQGVTPLMVAASQGHLGTVHALLVAGADHARRDYTGRTALMWADWNRRHAVVQTMRDAGVRE